MIDSVLVANRGEIACRVIRTARSLGLRTVAVYSDPDQDALHADLADESIGIGGASPVESYLDIGKILAAARTAGVGAIHPGCGFLAENDRFAEKVRSSGIVFIGPDTTTIRQMGRKDLAKRVMEDAQLPVIPGCDGSGLTDEQLTVVAETIGYPLMVKAVSGGGGRGMRMVRSPDRLLPAVAAARTEAELSFGNDGILLERFIGCARHIEVQVLADHAGNVVHLFERDCTLQRRNQKVIEEAPAPDLSADFRERLYEFAVRAARVIGYRGAGTVEFLADWSRGPDPECLWFMEMNTRLQVEHTVTEMITGLDLVELQFCIANGMELPFSQDELECSGHAFEARICTEDVGNGFLPSDGQITKLEFPADCRVDHGTRQWDTVSLHYDSLLAKLVVHGFNRKEALGRLSETLRATVIKGPVTNIPLLIAIADHAEFMQDRHDSGFMEREFGTSPDHAEPRTRVLFVAAAAVADRRQAGKQFSGFTLWNPLRHSVKIRWKDRIFDIFITFMRPGVYGMSTAGKRGVVARNGDAWHLDGTATDVACLHDNGRVYVFESCIWGFDVIDDLDARTGNATGAGSIVSPMPGTVTRMAVDAGDRVDSGDLVATIEAMKMVHEIRAPTEGIIAAVSKETGDRIMAGDSIATYRTEAGPED